MERDVRAAQRAVQAIKANVAAWKFLPESAYRTAQITAADNVMIADCTLWIARFTVGGAELPPVAFTLDAEGQAHLCRTEYYIEQDLAPVVPAQEGGEAQ